MLKRLHLNDIRVEDITGFFNTDSQVSVLRLDRIDPHVSGNKWFKLRYYIEEAVKEEKKGIVTFGGAWSNHISATAAICQEIGLAAMGIIRGERPASPSATLQFAEGCGMELRFIPREEYRHKIIPADVDMQQLYVIPEGGYGKLGAAGAGTIAHYIDAGFTHCVCAVGTGTTVAGLINAIGNTCQVTGISVLKNNLSLEQEIRALLENEGASSIIMGSVENNVKKNWTLNHHYHFGGYSKYTNELIAFMNELFTKTRVPTDFVYTAKLFYAVKQLLAMNYFPPNSKILLVHTGGLQGNASLPNGMLNF